MKIVVADDHEMLRELLGETLRDTFGGETSIEEVGDYNALFALAGSPPPDVILLDLNMPGRNDDAGIRKAIELFPSSKILVMSGLADPATARRLIEMGASGFVPKTVSHKSLKNAIRVIVDGEKYIHSFALSEVNDAGHVSPAADKNLPHFSQREQEIVNCLLDGNSNKEIARRLDIQEMTIKTHLRNIYRKLGAQNRADAVSRILRAEK